MTIKNKQVRNFNTGRGGYMPEAIVIHIMDGSLAGTDAWFNDPKSQVSAHYGIGKKGEVHMYVREQDTAWHAGRVLRATWKLIKKSVNPNLYTIGIEHEGKPLENDKWPDAMKKASAELIADIAKRWNIPIDRDHVIGHYEIFADKPNCPGVDHSIIDELVSMARKISGIETAGPTREEVRKAILLIRQADEILKKYE